MPKFFTCLVLLAAILLSAACDRSAGPALPAGSSAVQTFQRSVSLLKEGDLAGLLEHALPPAEFAKVKAEWDSHAQAKSVSAETRQRYASIMSKLTAADAEEALFREYEPDIRQFDSQYKNQMPGIIGMGKGYLTGVVSQNRGLSLAEKQQATQMLDALMQGIRNSNLTDPEKARQALSVAVSAARELDLKTLDQALALDFDHAAPKLQVAFKGLKRVLEVYGFSIDATLDSVAVEEIPSGEPDAARLKVSYNLLGTPVQTEFDMVRLDGRWYSRDTIERSQRKTGPHVATLEAPDPQ